MIVDSTGVVVLQIHGDMATAVSNSFPVEPHGLEGVRKAPGVLEVVFVVVISGRL